MASTTPEANKIKEIDVGVRMKEGMTCITYSSNRNIVLAVVAGAVEPFVTWKYEWSEENQTYVLWAGHYFRSLVNATTDFLLRP